jgi:hypothetical protein
LAWYTPLRVVSQIKTNALIKHEDIAPRLKSLVSLGVFSLFPFVIPVLVARQVASMLTEVRHEFVTNFG